MEGAQGKGHRVLVVDDEPDVLDALARAIGRAKEYECEVVTAQSAEEALRALERGEFSLVLSDFRMPGMNGIELLRAVRERYPATVRALITGYSDVSVAKEAINAARIDHYMEKPWDRDELRRTVKGLLDHHEFRRRTALEPGGERASEVARRFELEPGSIYWVPERKGRRSFEVLADLVTHGHQGLVITIQSPDVLRRQWGFERTRILFLGKERHGEDWVDASDIVEIGIIVRTFLEQAERGVAVLDGIEYLITSFSFETVVKLVQNLYEFNTFKRSLIILPINPEALERKELAILERYLEPLGGDGA